MLNRSVEERFWSKVDVREPDECWEWTAGRFPDGYGNFKLDGKARGAHRIMWLVTHGTLPPDLLVMHSCDNPPCVNPAHLSLGTHKDNSQDRQTKGRGHGNAKAGADNFNASMTADVARTIRRLAGAGLTPREIQDQTGVPCGTAWHIVKGRTWKDAA